VVESNEFERLIQARKEDYFWVEQKNRDIAGGTITFEEIDKLSEYGNIDYLMISGLKQDTFDYFVRYPGP
jgi:hypothetical protein